ncbi:MULTISPECIES: GTP-binding protein [unclassified Haloferax]|uniref:CobW family GTP-binding protein n=1 Tax=unclassified Haloferax TaxID=2625095 RepID=UPI0002B0605D|nr:MULTISPECIES: GTP-binding protein [unclassified Haloferax]ELZ57359.1 cobalamin synthesis protein/P47K [Haloferax sp. ATCC BAA-646]ELZ62323.1 cobalamin synthesis protein/P47K [Haloferax sp. ATCC BAA-645]ELZ65420.1 cobalamin synthesis protein/P47K [Haloferax sp. ATCC BAA-644]
MNAGETIPVTVLGGSLGAGKTTLLNHLLTNAGDRDIAVLVNDMGSVNVDVELVAEESDLAVGGGVTELSNGCICCELQDDLETAVVRLARERSFDHLVVEASGVSEPGPVARLFVTSRAAARYDVAGLATVVDSRLFADTFGGGDPDRTVAEEGDGSVRPLSDLLVEQVESADLVVLNKRDLVSDAELAAVRDAVEALRPGAAVVETTRGDVDVDLLLSDLHDPDAPVGWRAALEGETGGSDDNEGDRGRDERADADRDDHGHDHTHHDDHDRTHHGDHDHTHHGETAHAEATYGVTSFVYRRRAPLAPDGAAAVLGDLPDSVVRAKGSLWVAGAEDVHYTYSQAGPSAYVAAAGPWVASRPEFEQDTYRRNHPDFDWHDDHGDRRTELVFIGRDMDEDALAAALDAHLLDPGASADAGDFPTDPGEEVALAEPTRERDSVPAAGAVPEGRR